MTKARQERDEAKSGGNIQALRYEIALEKGLTKAQARRLVGESREELEEDAEEMVKEFGFKAKNKDDQTQDDDKDDDDTVEPRRGPRNRFSNPGDPDPNAGKGGKEPTPEDVYKGYRALV